MACASAERPSPTGPTFSAVLNFTETRSTSSPRVCRQPFADRQPEVLQLRPLQDHRGIHVDDAVAALLRQIAARAAGIPGCRSLSSADRYPGKCMPISPSAAAPRIASVMACARTSASEWPSRPNSHGTVTPPRISGRPGGDAVHVPAQAGADLAQARLAPRSSSLQEQVRQIHVAGLGDLDIAVAARHHADFHCPAAPPGWIRRCP